jgi:hypothetical protein
VPARPPRSKKLARLSPERRKALALLLRSILHEAKTRPCADCGNFYPRTFGGQMTFDHLDPTKKLFNIGGVGMSDDGELGHNLVTPEVLRAEIAKCEVVCLVCHKKRERRREAERAQLAERGAWIVFGPAAEIGHRLWVDAFRRFGLAFHAAHARGLEVQRARERNQRFDFEIHWCTAVARVVSLCSRGFFSKVFDPPALARPKLTRAEVDRWKKLVNPAPRPWKEGRA